MQISIGNLGAVLGTQLYRTNTAPRYVLGHSFALGYLVANIVVVSVLWRYLTSLNKKRDEILLRSSEKRDVYDSDDFQGDADVRWRFEV